MKQDCRCLGAVAVAVWAALLFPVRSASSRGERIRVVGHTGGRCEAVCGAANYAYIGEGPQLTVVDVSNGARPHRVGWVFLPGNVKDLFLVGDLVFAAASGGGLQIVDVADPTSPTIRGEYGTPQAAEAVSVTSDTVYVLAEDLLALDVSDPSSPALLSKFPVSPAGRDLCVVGLTAYIANEQGLLIVDVTESSSPSLHASYDIPRQGFVVSASSATACVANPYGLEIIDVSDPSSPTLLCSFPRLEPGRPYPNGLRFWGNLVYQAYPVFPACCCGAGGCLEILDISVPTSPSRAGLYWTRAGACVSIAGDRALVGSVLGGLDVFDFHSPTMPTLLGSYETPASVQSVYAAGGKAYVTGCYEGLQILDVSDPSSPSTSLCRYFSRCCTIDQVFAVSGDLAYVQPWSGSGFEILDVGDPTSPTRRGGYASPDYLFMDAAIRGNRAYLTAWEWTNPTGVESAVEVVDLTDPASPTLLGRCPAIAQASRICVSDDLAFVVCQRSPTDTRNGLQIFDVGYSSSPTALAFYETSERPRRCFAAGPYAYLVADGLQILDVSSPRSPRLVSTYRLDVGRIGDIFVSDPFAYLADDQGCLHALDVSLPSRPKPLSRFEIPAHPVLFDLMIADGLIYLGASNGLWILEYTGQQPSSAANWALYDTAVDVR